MDKVCEVDNKTQIASNILNVEDVGVFVIDERNRIRVWNHWMNNWTAMPESEVMGSDFFSLFSGLVASDFALAVQRACRNGVKTNWSQAVDPERVDLLEIAMNGGTSELPLHHIIFSPFKLSEANVSCLVQLIEGPYENTMLKRIGHSVRPDSVKGFMVELDLPESAVLVVNSENIITRANFGALNLFGYPEGRLEGKPLRLLLPDFSFSSLSDKGVENVLDGVSAYGDEIPLSVIHLTGADRKSHALLCNPISDTRLKMEFMAHQREVISSIYQNTADGIMLLGRDGYVEQINPVGRHLLGLPDVSDLSDHVDDVLHLVDGSGEPAISPPMEAISRGATVESMNDIFIRVRGREPEPAVIIATPLRNKANQVDGCVVVFRSVSEARRVSNRLSWQATHDALTQLPNRRYLETALLSAIDEVHVDSRVRHTLLYIDVYNFSVINDTCGHNAGDQLLNQFARMLQQHFASDDVVARIGNDEFAVLVRDKSVEQARELADSLLETVKNFIFPWEERRLKVGLSIGAKVIDEKETSEIDILVAAGSSCAAAKESGRNRVIFKYQTQDVENRKSMAEWIPLISEALEEDRFELFCQPIVPIADQQESERHFEVLARMRDPEGDLVLPGKFIPAAEHYGLIEDIDKWVLDAIFKYQQQRRDLGLPLARYSINLSGKSIGDENLQQIILDHFHRTELDPHLFQFEITETAAIRNFDHAMHLISTLRGEGCYFSLDDFGSGLSSLGYLKELPVDYLKIDGSFISNMELNEVDFSMVSTINHLGHIMGIKTIAECVETSAQLDLLKEIGVDYAQGFYIDIPRPISYFEDDD